MFIAARMSKQSSFLFEVFWRYFSFFFYFSIFKSYTCNRGMGGLESFAHDLRQPFTCRVVDSSNVDELR